MSHLPILIASLLCYPLSFTLPASMGTRFKTESKDPAVNVTTWVLLVVVILSVSARLGTKFNLFHKLTIDDLLIVASLV